MYTEAHCRQDGSRAMRLVRARARQRSAAVDGALGHLKAGDVTGLSIGFRVSPEGVEFDRTAKARILKEVALIEVSLVALPANQSARVTGVKSINAKPTTLRELEAAGVKCDEDVQPADRFDPTYLGKIVD